MQHGHYLRLQDLYVECCLSISTCLHTAVRTYVII